ncbi:c-type cytochrome [Piscinibacter terrae]|uniref:Cytochrome c4 n=1 Tax=Piscinibacter terrae TaxID=2496871 RepID=A0A3N7HIW8_9BURK|nr:c-type cytochrome [Albitalea terrae]RQP21987.1 cytochrome c4 [Albitalea terrae]
MFAALAHAQAVAVAQEVDTIAERTRPCTACHGKEGRATPDGYFPRIAGKPAGYLYNQLVNFREGRRQNGPMTYLVQHMSDAYLREIAAHFSSLDLPYPPSPQLPLPAEVLQRGETLALQGDAQRKVPACVQCHGSALTGVSPAMPGLLGLPRDYVISQFGAWRTGQRKAAQPDCMAQVTQRLAPQDIAAVAGWLSTRPLPTPAKPASSIAMPLPMDCGSGPTR